MTVIPKPHLFLCSMNKCHMISGFCIQSIFFFVQPLVITESKKWLSFHQKTDVAQGLSVLRLGSHIKLSRVLGSLFQYQPPPPFNGGFFPLTKRKIKESTNYCVLGKKDHFLQGSEAPNCSSRRK